MIIEGNARGREKDTLLSVIRAVTGCDRSEDTSNSQRIPGHQAPASPPEATLHRGLADPRGQPLRFVPRCPPPCPYLEGGWCARRDTSATAGRLRGQPSVFRRGSVIRGGESPPGRFARSQAV